MAMMLAGVGSLIGHELARLAVDNAPVLKQVAKNTAVDIAKKSFNLVLDNNPNFSNFLGHFGIHKFGQAQHSTFTNRGRHRRITHHNY
jgi:hypothetical protein